MWAIDALVYVSQATGQVVDLDKLTSGRKLMEDAKTKVHGGERACLPIKQGNHLVTITPSTKLDSSSFNGKDLIYRRLVVGWK